MFKHDNAIYAGITTMDGLDFYRSNLSAKNNTGYIFRDVRSGNNLGNAVNTDEIDERFLVEVEDEYDPNYLIEKNIMYAGLENLAAIELYLLSEGYTGKIFKRIHDGVEIGSSISLCNDWSYYGNKPRVDKPQYYIEIEKMED